MKAGKRVVFLGLDSADPGLLLRWSEERVLPTFLSLRKGGLCGRTTMPPGLGTGAMWTSLYSGVSPGKHGRYFGRQFNARKFQAYRFVPSKIKREPFWNVLSRAGRRVAIIDFPIAPLCENLNGIQIKDWGTHDAVYPSVRTWPADLAEEVTERFGTDPVGPCDVEGRGPAEFKELRDRLIKRVERKTDLIEHFLKNGGWDLFMAVFSDSHCVGHQCWHLHDPAHPMHDAEFLRTIGDPIKDVYVALDTAIGRLLEHVGPEAVVIVFAGSGMGPDYTANHLLDDILRRIEGVPPMSRLTFLKAMKAVYRWTVPKGLRARLTPLAYRVDESSLAKERSQRKFFAIPHNDISGAVRLNLEGRERNGKVKPGAEYDECCEALRKDLLDLVNLETGKPLVKTVLRTVDLFEGKHVGDLPDLLVEWNRDAPITSIGSPKVGHIEGTYLSGRTGDHMPDGLFFVRGPGIRGGGCVEKAVLVECFAPTLSSLLGTPLSHVDGVPILQLCGS